ncbi:MAG: alpha/beta hydrolase [Treponema sp.]|nr:alpha/beta hydrolase [Treponema sp.]
MKKALIGIFCFLMAFSVCAEEKVYLWPGKKGPGSENFTAKEVVKTKDDRISTITSISEPYFTVQKAKKAKNKKVGIVMFAGGAYAEVALKTLHDVAERYCAEGYTCFLVVYRLPTENGHENPMLVPLQDAQRAIRLVRSQASKYGIAENKIGVFGESAGGHLAARLATRYDEKAYEPIDGADTVSARPDFQVLRVPAFNKINGEDVPVIPHVTANTPKAFIVSASDDTTAQVKNNALSYFEALWTQGVDSEIHVFQNGGHRFDKDGTNRVWLDLSVNWLNEYVK